MARWRKQQAQIEPPAWYRAYQPEAWDQPDAHEQAMIDGLGGHRAWPDDPESRWPGFPAWLHDHHARRRWEEARHRYRQENPRLAEQEFNAIVARRAVRRAGSPG